MTWAMDLALSAQGRDVRKKTIWRWAVVLIWIGLIGAFPLHAASPKRACPSSGEIPKRLVTKLYQNHSTPDRARRKLQAMVRAHGPVDLERVASLMHPEYTHKLFLRGVTDQWYSGDCWIMAFNNVVRHRVSVEQGYSDVSLSRTYLKFWSLFELSNLFLEKVITSKHRTVKSAYKIFQEDISQGGHYDWAAYLVNKYGMVSYEAMPDTHSSRDAGILMESINAVARRYGVHILSQKTHKTPKQLRKIKQQALAEIWRILVAELGMPPREFEYRRSNQRELVEVDEETMQLSLSRSRDLDPRVLRTLTPRQFARQELQFHPDDYVTLGHFANHPMNRKIRVVDQKLTPKGSSLMFLNVPKKIMLQVLLRSMAEGEPSWIGLDYSHGVDEWNGVIDPHILINEHVGPQRRDGVPELSPADLIRVGASVPNHAMIVLGVDAPRQHGANIRQITPNHVRRLLLENTHGAQLNDDGYVHLSREGFDSNVFEVVVRKDLLPPDIQALLESRAHRVKWDSAPELRRLVSR